MAEGKVVAPDCDLRWLTDVYAHVQKIQLGVGNYIWAVTNGRDGTTVPPFVTMVYQQLGGIVSGVQKEMNKAVRDHIVWPWISGVRGIGPVLATKLLGLIGDISKFDTVSKLWRFCGYACIDGKAERPTKGEKLHYSKRLRSLLYVIGDSFLKANSPYRDIYDSAKAHYEKTHPEWTLMHRHFAAKRKMVKLFLSHLWVVWRELEGLPTRAPYSHEYLGHTTYIDPWAFSDHRQNSKIAVSVE